MIGIGIGISPGLNGAGGGVDVTATGTLLVDFTVQPITATAVTYGASGQTVTNDGAFGNYTATANVIAHDSALTGATTTKISDGWQFTNTASTAPGSAKDFRPAITFSPALDFTNVESLVFEWGFPVASDDCQGLSVGIRPRVMDGAGYFYPTNTMLTFQTISKSEKMMTRVNCGALSAGGWLSSGTPSWGNITQIQPRLDVVFTNGGTEVVLRRIWVNRKQAKAKIAFNFDDLLTQHYTNAAPIMSAAGAKVGLAATTATVDPSDPDWVSNPTFMTEAQLLELYQSYGWSVYPHMRSHSPALAAGLTFVSYTAGSPNLTRFSVADQKLIDALNLEFTPVGSGGGGKVVGTDTVTIRGGWGPEYTGAHVVHNIDTVNKRFDVRMGATAPYQTAAASLTGFRMDWPNSTRAALMAAEIDPCVAYLDSLLGAGYRGSSVFVVPKGDYDPSYVADLQAYGFKGARSTNFYATAVPTQTAAAPLKTSTSTQSGTPCAVGWFDQWDIRVIVLDGVAYANVANYTAIIDDAVAHGHFVCFLSHYVTAGVTPAANTTSSEVLTDLVAYCKTKVDAGTAQWVTLEEMVEAFA